MDNAYKQLFFGPKKFPSDTCPFHNSLDSNTWLRVLLCCQQSIHALQIKRHNEAAWKIRKISVSRNTSKSYILVNVRKDNTYMASMLHIQKF